MSPTIDKDSRPPRSRRSRISDRGLRAGELGSAITSPRVRSQTTLQTTAGLPPTRAAFPDLADRRGLDVADCLLRRTRRHITVRLHLEHPERSAQELGLVGRMGLDRHTEGRGVAEIPGHDRELRLAV